ncbi:hypothetical protein GGF46_002083 [Coemansia sp. RSA 552]|nr:hypothetical protein GGF46_002083 [Coemansia sp. RSA 552]
MGRGSSPIGAEGSTDDVWDQEDGDNHLWERDVAARSLAKLERAFSNSGYKEGVDASRESHMQDGFDQALSLAIGHGHTLGSLLGALVAHRAVCRKLGLEPRVSDLDALIMRLRAFKYSAAFDLETIRTTTDVPDPTTAAFKALVDEASSTLGVLTSQK